MGIIKIIVIISSVAVIAVGVWFIIKKKRKICRKSILNSNSPIPPDVDRDKAKEEFLKISFDDAYESLYRVAKGTSAKPIEIIRNWNTRIHYLDSCPNVQKLWLSLFENYENFSPEQLKENAKIFVEDFIFSTGIVRHSESHVKVDETTQYQYYTIDDEELVNGILMKVKFACWTLGDKVLEKGVLIPNE